MTDPAATQNPAIQPAERTSAPEAPAGSAHALDRIYSFRFTYIAIALFLVLYIFSVKAAEVGLEIHFANVVADAIQIDNYFSSVSEQIKEKLDLRVKQSRWVRIWDVNVSVMVLASDGFTWLYVDGHAPPASPGLSVQGVLSEAQRLLPAQGEVLLSVPHNTLLSNTILIAYAALLFQVLFVYNRRIARQENELLSEALALRDTAAERAERIEDEIEGIRQQLLGVEPAEREQQEEISGLQAEREALESQLQSLATRERELRGKADRAVVLEQERRALEDLLEEASTDLTSKDGEIRELERNLKRATKASGGPTGRSKESEVIAKRMRTLYKNIEIDDRAIEDLVALRDEGTKLRAEECIKRLSEEADNVGIRRKVGGLPNHLNIFELGFAGKRRVYYTKGQQRRARILVIGAKNTQQNDLDYIARLSKREVGAL